MKDVKYWLYLAAKLLAGATIMAVVQSALLGLYPVPAASWKNHQHLLLTDLPFTFLVVGIWLLGAGVFFTIIWDQRRRCRTCLRKLIMPVNTGSWGHLITFGRPRIEWICAYGHGTLSIEELQITGRQLPDWRPHDDNIWKELDSYYQARE